jgi:hypothetical protein
MIHYRDDPHWTNRGHELVAKLVAAYLRTDRALGAATSSEPGVSRGSRKLLEQPSKR